MGRVTIALCAAVALLAHPTITAQANAERLSGSCGAQLNDVDIPKHVSSDIESAISIPQGESVVLSYQGTGPTDQFDLFVDVSGYSLRIDPSLFPKPKLELNQWSVSLDSSLLEAFRPGLYRVTAETIDGPGACELAALIKLPGDWKTPLGIGATAAVIVAGIALTVTLGNSTLAVVRVGLRIIFGRGRRKRDADGEGEGGAEAEPEPMTRDERATDSDWWQPRFKWSFGLSLLGSFAGLVFGGGLAVLLQQASLSPLSLELTLKVVLPSALIPPALEGLAVFERTIFRRGRTVS